MGDGRDSPFDRKFASHSIAFFSSWAELDDSHDQIIPDYVHNVRLGSLIRKQFENGRISSSLNEVNNFSDDIWIPFNDMVSYANNCRFISQNLHPIGYRILVTEPFFQAAYARHPDSRLLLPVYHLLVSNVLREIDEKKHALV